MATKPAATPRWANVGGVIVEPPSGKKDIGWEDGESPPAEYFNWLHNSNWLWLEYLREGRLRGPIRIGNTDTMPGGFAGLMVDDDLQVSGDGAVDGTLSADTLAVAGSMTVGQGIAAQTAITTDQHVEAREVCHQALRELQLPAAAGIANMQTGGMFWDNVNKSWGNFSGSPDIVDFPIPLHARTVLHRFTCTYLTNGAGTRSFRLMRRVGASIASIRSFSSTTTGLTTRTFNITPVFLDPGAHFTLECNLLGGDAIHGVSVWYGYPFQVGVGAEVP